MEGPRLVGDWRAQSLCTIRTPHHSSIARNSQGPRTGWNSNTMVYLSSQIKSSQVKPGLLSHTPQLTSARWGRSRAGGRRAQGWWDEGQGMVGGGPRAGAPRTENQHDVAGKALFDECCRHMGACHVSTSHVIRRHATSNARSSAAPRHEISRVESTNTITCANSTFAARKFS